MQPALDSDDEDDLNGDEARTARRVARALASGVEPRLLVPAYVSCVGRAWASSTDGAPAAALKAHEGLRRQVWPRRGQGARGTNRDFGAGFPRRLFTIK